MHPSTCASRKDDDGDDSVASSLADQLMKKAREQVAREFMEACGKDKEKQKIVQDLSNQVLGYKMETQESDHNDESDMEEDDENDEEEKKMEEITEFPYEEDTDAEVKEKPFDDFKALLKPESKTPGQRSRRNGALIPTKEAVHAFGKEIAQRVVLAYHHISKAGQTYSNQWLEGDIRDVECGKIKKSLLLMCLQERKLATATQTVLGKICEDLELNKLVKAALTEWGVVENFPTLAECKQISFQYASTNRKQCQQCEIFVARAYVCEDTLNCDLCQDDLVFKLMACFEIMEDNLLTESTKLPSRRNSTGNRRGVREADSVSSESPAGRTKSRIVEKIDLETHKVLGRYKSVAEAASSITINIKPDSVLNGLHAALRRSSRSCGGFFWCYKGQSRIPPQKTNANATIAKISVSTGKTVKLYENARTCQRENGSMIYHCLRTQKSSHGFNYRYASETLATQEENNQVVSFAAKGKSRGQISGQSRSDDDVPVLSNSIEVSARVETGSDDEPGQSSGEQDRTPSLTSHDDPDETPDAWPYEEDENAEEEERAFDAFKAFFKPNISASNQSSRRNSGMQSSKEAIERFGEETAQSLVLTYRQIEKSLITYSSTWETGVIQDVSCGRLAKPLMLMCLQEERFAGANRAVLGKITEELESGKLIYRALKHWGVEDTYIQLVQWKKLPFQYVSKHRKQCQKCEIFVARAHACMEYLGFKRLTASMSEKVLSCLATMDNNLLGHSTKSHSRQNSYENQNPVANVSPLKSSQPSKKQVGTRFTSNGSADRKEATRAKSSDRKEYLEVKSSDLTEKKKDTKRKASSDVQAKERRKAAKLSEGQSSRTLRSSPAKLSEGQSSRTLRSSPTRTPASSFASVRSLPVSKSSIALAPPRSACDAPEIDGGDDAKKSNTNTKFFDPNFFRDFVRGKRAPEIDGGHDAKKSNKNTELLDQNDQCDFEEKRKRSLGKLPQESANEAEHSKSGKGKQTIGPEPKKSASSQPSEIPAAVLRHVEQFIPVSGDGAPSLKAITAMDEVEESPYLSNRSAEVGEEIFDSFKAFLEPQDDRGRHLEPSNEAAQAFGKALAKSVVKAYSEIAKSGMTYGSSWKDGVIRGINCGFIPRPMMLLCLQEQRLAIGTDDVLARIISDLGVCGIVTDAIEHWKLQKNYPLLNTFSSLSGLHAKKHSTLRCIVFVARTYRCMIALQRRSIGDSLMKKVQACLSIIHLSLERQAEHKMHKASGSDKGSASHYKSKSRREKIAPKPASPPEQVPARFHSLEHDSGDTESALPTTTRIMHNLLEKSPTSRNDSPSKKGDQAFFPHRLMGKSFRQQTHELAALERQAPADLPMKEPPAQEHPSNSAANSIHAQPSQKANDTRALLKEPTQAQTNTTLTTPHGKVVQLPTLDKKKKPIGPWYPIDENEMILNATEAELAWLTEESTFSLRSERNDIQWDFVWQYASPSLKIELRRIPDDSGSRLDRLVRLDDGLVNKRFDVVRKEIRSKLYRGVLRTMMRGVIPVLRHKTRQYNTK